MASSSKHGRFLARFPKHIRNGGGVFLFSLFSLLPLLLPAQSKTDSLKQLLKTAKGLERAEVLLDLSRQTQRENVGMAIEQATEAYRIAQQVEDGRVQIIALRKLGQYNSMIDRDTIALNLLLDAKDLSGKLGLRVQEAAVHQSLGNFYRTNNIPSKALEHYLQALRIQREKENKKDMVWTLSQIANIYIDRNESAKALGFVEDAVVMAEELDDYMALTSMSSLAAENLMALGRFQEATRYFDIALDAVKKLGSKHAQAEILRMVSEAYGDEKLYDKAIGLNQEYIAIAKKEGNNSLLGVGYLNLGVIYSSKGDLALANDYFIKSKKAYGEIRVFIPYLTIRLMQNYLKQDQHEKALRLGQKALPKIMQSASIQYKKDFFKILAETYKKNGDFQNALLFQEKVTDLNMQIFDLKKEAQIAETQGLIQIERKTMEIGLLEKEKEKATLLRNALFGGFALLLVIALLVFNRQRLKIHKNKTEHENFRLKENQFEKNLEFKNRQLTTHSLNLVQKNEVMKDLKNRIDQLQSQSEGRENKDLLGLKHLIDYSFNLDKDWEEFKHYFEDVHSSFFEAMKKQAPGLSPSELKLAALVKLNLSIKEISTLMAITPDSVKTSRHRLRKKLGLETEDNLPGFLNQIEKTPPMASRIS